MAGKAGRIVTAYKCHACGGKHLDPDEALECCPLEEVQVVSFGRVGGIRECEDILCFKCRHHDFEGRRYPPCPELSGSDNFLAECEHYEYTAS